MLRLLEISLVSGVLVSLRNIPEKYDIITRLWANCFYRLLENLRRYSLNSRIALGTFKNSSITHTPSIPHPTDPASLLLGR
jgi:hypothetical protein